MINDCKFRRVGSLLMYSDFISVDFSRKYEARFQRTSNNRFDCINHKISSKKWFTFQSRSIKIRLTFLMTHCRSPKCSEMSKTRVNVDTKKPITIIDGERMRYDKKLKFLLLHCSSFWWLDLNQEIVWATSKLENYLFSSLKLSAQRWNLFSFVLGMRILCQNSFE